jgi:S1-C subfamily serine protease
LVDGEEMSAKRLADSQGDDVALLQLPKSGLTSAPFSPNAEPRRGVIVVVPIPGKDVSETGVVSVDGPIEIRSKPGHVTVAVDMRKAGVTATSIIGAFDGDDFRKLIRGLINEGDIITHVEGEEVPDSTAYERELKKDTFIAGDFIQLSVRRDGVTSQVALPIQATNPGDSIIRFEGHADLSLRRYGLPAVIVHDTIVERRQCGGPVVDLEGRVVGVNIARFDRCSTLAIPPQRIQRLVHELLTKARPDR